MKGYLFVFAVLVFFHDLSAQITNSRGVQIGDIGTAQDVEALDGKVTNYYYKKPEVPVQGSPYLEEAFLKGTINLYKDTLMNIPIRYNIYREQMEFIFNRDTMIMGNVMGINYVTIGDRTFQTSISLEGLNYVENHFFEVIYDGEYKLLLRRITDIHEDTYVSNYMGGGGSGARKYRTDEYYYVKKGNGTATRLPRYKSALYQKFPSYRKELKSYIKENDLKLREKENMIKVFGYLNSLL